MNHNMTFTLIRHIIDPPLEWSLIPYLLSLLVQVERLRQSCVKRVDEYLLSLKTADGARRSNNYGQNKEDLKKLQRVCKAKSNVSMRAIFRTTVLGLCEMHINRLWTSQESYILPKQMRTYFPSLHNVVDDRLSDKFWQHHYLSDSTSEEREEIHSEGLVCKAFLDKARKWETEWKANLTPRQREEDKDNDLYEKSFSSKFPGPDEETLLTNIRVFIERVEGSVSTVSENAL